MSVVSGYFPDATYYKPTGDGLLMIFSCSSGKEVDITKSVVERSIKLVSEFCSLCKGDSLVYFKTPSNIGLGISRGAACCISSEDEILDFSGKPLNLASRLSDMARPFEVVFDESVSSCIPAGDLEKNFLSENVYVKGMAEDEPIKVYLTKGTIIPSSYKKPLNEPEWMTDSRGVTIKQLLAVTATDLSIILSKIPKDESQILVTLTFPELGGTGRSHWSMKTVPSKVYYEKRGKEHYVFIEKQYMIERLQTRNVQPDTPVQIVITYPIKA